MKVVEFLAIAGAMAWLPHLISFFRDLFTKPVVSIITAKTTEVGFSTFGPILNIRLAFSVKNRDVTISGIHFHLKHESGETQSFFWQGVIQELFRLKTPDDEQIPYEKEHNVLAIKLLEKDVEERLIRFQEPKYHENKDVYESKAFKKLIHLRETNTFDGDEFLRSEEMKDLIQYIKQAFSWKHGKYEITFQIESYDKFTLTDNKYEFFLSPLDVEALEKNRDLIEPSYRETFAPEDAESKLEFNWNWRYPALKKVI
ncbi:MAG: hypothetical protein KAU06_08340 [Candidatus Marinimicrobia bacterium]|nr:hypothetical protein [Candidatus Neomarinimicrobiota bacterium]